MPTFDKVVRARIIEACDGDIALGFAYSVFSYIDPRLQQLPFCEPVAKFTPKTKVDAYNMKFSTREDIAKLFDPLSLDWDALSLTQQQIVNYAHRYKSKLIINGWTLCLFACGQEYYFSCLGFTSILCLDVHVLSVADLYAWSPQARYQIVVPQLII